MDCNTKDDTLPFIGWDGIRELDRSENWRVRNDIITKNDHVYNAKLIESIVKDIIEEFVSKYIQNSDGIIVFEKFNLLEEKGGSLTSLSPKSSISDHSDEDLFHSVNQLNLDEVTCKKGNLQSTPLISSNSAINTENASSILQDNIQLDKRYLPDKNTSQKISKPQHANMAPPFFGFDNFKPINNSTFELDFLESIDTGSQVHMPRESLFLKFDPIISNLQKENSLSLRPDIKNNTNVNTRTNNQYRNDTKIKEHTSSDKILNEEVSNDKLPLFDASLTPDVKHDKCVSVVDDLIGIGSLIKLDDYNISALETTLTMNDDVNLKTPTDSKINQSLNLLSDSQTALTMSHVPNLLTETPSVTKASCVPANLLFDLEASQATPNASHMPNLLSDTVGTNISHIKSISLINAYHPADLIADNSISGNKSTVLKYTLKEVGEIIKGDKAKCRMESRKLHKHHQLIYNSTKMKFKTLLAEEREKENCNILRSEQLLEEKKQVISNISSQREMKMNQINNLCMVRDADLTFLKTEKEILLDELAKADNLLEMGKGKLESIIEEWGKQEVEREKVQNEFEEVEASHMKFNERCQELHRSVLASRERVANLFITLEQTDTICAEAYTKFSRLSEKAFQKSNSANKMHNEISKKTQESHVMLNVHLKKKQLELQEVKSEIKKYGSENENLEALSNELMATLYKKE